MLVLLAALCAASAAALGLNYALAGPRLGPVYDFLLKRRPPPPVSREILLINTDEIVEGGDVFAVLMALNELEAASVIIEVPVLGSSSVRIGTEEEIRQHFEDEYSLLGANIRNLFEAIRLGSVPPAESPAYVENLVELAERGRDRLTGALISRDEAGPLQAARAAAAFGSVLEARDLRSRPLGESPWYARPRPDPDGILRRVAPLLGEARSAVRFWPSGNRAKRAWLFPWTGTAISWPKKSATGSSAGLDWNRSAATRKRTGPCGRP